MNIFYVHHANRERNKHPSQKDRLTKIGIKDAKLVAKLFLSAKKAGVHFKAIYTSPYNRCKKTAKIINKYLKIPLIEDERLNEFVNERQAKKYGLPLNVAETWLNCQMRNINCIKDIVNTYNDDDNVICVTSGVNLTAFISLAYQIKPSENLPYPIIPSCSPIGFKIDKTSFKFLDK